MKLSIRESLIVGQDAPITTLQRKFLIEPKPVDAPEFDEEPTLRKFFPLLDVAGTTDFVEVWSLIFSARHRPVILLRGKRLNHAENTIGTQRVLHHSAITRFEDVQRQNRPRQEHDSGQGKHRQSSRQRYLGNRHRHFRLLATL